MTAAAVAIWLGAGLSSSVELRFDAAQFRELLDSCEDHDNAGWWDGTGTIVFYDTEAGWTVRMTGCPFDAYDQARQLAGSA